MKKKIGIAVASLVGVGILGFGVYQSDAAPAKPNLSSTEVREMVLTQYPGTITEFELERNGNKAVYEVEVISNGFEHDLKLDGNTGEVLKTKEKESLNRENVTDDDDFEYEKISNQTKSEKISLQAAEEIALNKFAGTVTESELDEDDGRLVYQFEIENGNREAEIEIDAFTGDIIELEIDED